MAVGNTQYLAIYLENVAYGTFPVSPTAIPIRIHSDNGFSGMTPMPMRHEIRSADSGNLAMVNVSGRFTVQGQLTTYLYYEQADTIMGWCSTLTSNDLPSYSIQYYDGVRTRRYLGAKVMSATFTCAADQDEGCVLATLNLVAQKPDTSNPTFAAPDLNTYGASGVLTPVRLVDSKYTDYGTGTDPGLINATSGSTARTKYKGFTWSIENILRPTFDEDVYISDCTYNGRTINYSFPIRFTAATDRAAFEAQTVHTGTMTFRRTSPDHILTLDFKTANYMGGLERTMPIGDNIYETINMRCFRPIGSADFSYTKS